MGNLKFSVVTVSFNQGKFIEETIVSVLRQNYPDFEHIIIDGGSTDNTLDILRSYPHLTWVSEPDEGQAYAINKGFAMATGDVIAWINSDDYHYPGAFHKVAAAFKNNQEASVIYGDCLYYFENSAEHYVNINSELDFEKMLRYWSHNVPPNQPSVFFKRSLLKEFGSVDTSLKYMMDYDLFLRFAQKHKFYYIPETLSVYRFHKESKSGFANWSVFYPETREIYMRYKHLSSQHPDGPIGTLAVAFVKAIHEESLWHIKSLKNTIAQVMTQINRDLEVLIITDVSGAGEILNIHNTDLDIRIIEIDTMSQFLFYQAVALNLTGYFVHFPSIIEPLHTGWFKDSINVLLDNPEKLYFYDIWMRGKTHPVIADGEFPGPQVSIRRSFYDCFNPFSAYTVTDKAEFTVVVTYAGSFPLLLHTIYTVTAQCKNMEIEVIAVLPEGLDGSSEWLSHVKGLRVVTASNSINLSGVLAAEPINGKYVAFVHGACEMKAGFFKVINESFARINRCGFLGIKIVNHEGQVKNIGSTMWANGYFINHLDFGDDPNSDKINYIREIDFYAEGCFAVLGDILREYAQNYRTYKTDLYQAADLCFFVRSREFKVFYFPDTEVSLIAPDENYIEKPQPNSHISDELLFRDRCTFLERWKSQLELNHFHRDYEFSGRTYRYGKTAEVLFVSTMPSVTDTQTGNFNLRTLTAELMDSGAKVSFYHEHNILKSQIENFSQFTGIEVCFDVWEFEEFIRLNRDRFDLIWLRGRTSAFYKLGVIRKCNCNATVVCEVEDGQWDISTNRVLSEYERGKLLEVNQRQREFIYKYAAILVVDLKTAKANSVSPKTIEYTEVSAESLSEIIEKGRNLNSCVNISAMLREKNDIVSVTLDELRKIIPSVNDREIYIWGAGTAGISTRFMLNEIGFYVNGFIDGNPDRWGTVFYGLDIYSPDSLKNRQNNRPFVVVASMYFAEIGKKLSDMGYVEKTDFVNNVFY
ncbi:glycosyltransferase family 2 protein [Candidatus Magnetomonas plexicatena]|uniref:glycosyltransferase family 2 protein n=1 Tax=Candidatus Magnetomonas plexicatena TaxID=2552947 RepID=UPI001C746CDC|nr:glycosyltransferase [Nitrospirales bacterium LBB_01]